MENNSENSGKTLLPHHVQQELCTTRPLYRQGRKLTAVKVYTINNESQHLLIFQVPKINLSNELKNLCLKYGELKLFHVVTDRETEIFTECYHVQYHRIQSARVAKRLVDNKSFYGDVLHVCYAPEYESVAETRAKLQQRKTDVLSRLQPGPSALEYLNVQRDIGASQDRKRKCPALPITEKRLKAEHSNDIWTGIPAELDPRISSSTPQEAKTGFKKHFQLAQPKGVEYGPYIPPANMYKPVYTDSNHVNIPTKKSETVRTTLLPTTVIKNYKHECTKRIVFRNNKKCL